MRKLIRDNGLSIALMLLFAFSILGQSVAGLYHYNEDQREHNQVPITYVEYLTTGAFIESVFENWESEFLQMAVYVWLTGFLYQRGSAESKDPDKDDPVDEDPSLHTDDSRAPYPVRIRGLALKLYEQSLVLALLLLFLVSAALHLAGSARENCREQSLHGQPCTTALAHATSATFWFESLQNWQSEFLSIGVLVVLSIFLRQKGSPESKPVHAPHAETGR